MTAFQALVGKTFLKTVIQLPKRQSHPHPQNVEGIIKVKPTNRLRELIDVVETDLIVCIFRCVNPALEFELNPGDSVLVVNTQSTIVSVNDSLKVVEVNESSVGIINPIVGKKLTLLKNTKHYHT